MIGSYLGELDWDFTPFVRVSHPTFIWPTIEELCYIIPADKIAPQLRAYDPALILYLLSQIHSSDDISREYFLDIYIRAYRFKPDVALRFYLFFSYLSVWDTAALPLEHMLEALDALTFTPGDHGPPDDAWLKHASRQAWKDDPANDGKEEIYHTYELSDEDFVLARSKSLTDLPLYDDTLCHFTEANYTRWRDLFRLARNKEVAIAVEPMHPITQKLQQMEEIDHVPVNRPKFYVSHHRGFVPADDTLQVPPQSQPPPDDDGNETEATTYTTGPPLPLSGASMKSRRRKRFAMRDPAPEEPELTDQEDEEDEEDGGVRTSEGQEDPPVVYHPFGSARSTGSGRAPDAPTSLLMSSDPPDGAGEAALPTPKRPTRARRAMARVPRTPKPAASKKSGPGTSSQSGKRKATASATRTPTIKRSRTENTTIPGSPALPDYATPRKGYQLWQPGIAVDNTQPVKIGGSIDLANSTHKAYFAISCPAHPDSMPPKNTHLEDYHIGQLIQLAKDGVLSLASLQAHYPDVFTTKYGIHDHRRPFGRPYVIENDQGEPMYAIAYARTILCGGGGVDRPYQDKATWIDNTTYPSHAKFKEQHKDDANAGKPEWLLPSDRKLDINTVHWPTLMDPARAPKGWTVSLRKSAQDETLEPAVRSALKDAANKLLALSNSDLDERRPQTINPITKKHGLDLQHEPALGEDVIGFSEILFLSRASQLEEEKLRRKSEAEAAAARERQAEMRERGLKQAGPALQDILNDNLDMFAAQTSFQYRAIIDTYSEEQRLVDERRTMQARLKDIERQIHRQQEVRKVNYKAIETGSQALARGTSQLNTAASAIDLVLSPTYILTFDTPGSDNKKILDHIKERSQGFDINWPHELKHARPHIEALAWRNTGSATYTQLADVTPERNTEEPAGGEEAEVRSEPDTAAIDYLKTLPPL